MRKLRLRVTVSLVQDDQGSGNSPPVRSPLCSVGKTVLQVPHMLAMLWGFKNHPPPSPFRRWHPYGRRSSKLTPLETPQQALLLLSTLHLRVPSNHTLCIYFTTWFSQQHWDGPNFTHCTNWESQARGASPSGTVPTSLWMRLSSQALRLQVPPHSTTLCHSPFLPPAPAVQTWWKTKLWFRAWLSRWRDRHLTEGTGLWGSRKPDGAWERTGPGALRSRVPTAHLPGGSHDLSEGRRVPFPVNRTPWETFVRLPAARRGARRVALLTSLLSSSAGRVRHRSGCLPQANRKKCLPNPDHTRAEHGVCTSI